MTSKFLHDDVGFYCCISTFEAQILNIFAKRRCSGMLRIFIKQDLQRGIHRDYEKIHAALNVCGLNIWCTGFYKKTSFSVEKVANLMTYIVSTHDKNWKAV